MSRRPKPTRVFPQIVNEAVRRSLAEDAEDLEAFDERRREQNLKFEDVVRNLRLRGKI